MASTDNFVGKVVGLVIAVVVICAVAIPIIGGMVGTDVPASGTPGTDGYVAPIDYPINAGTTEATIVQILPVFLVLAILIMIVKMFLDNRNAE